MVFITIIESLLLLYFGYVVAYTFIFSKVPSLTEAPTTYSRFAVFILPSYKEDAVILPVARKALQQTYPQYLYSIIVIADSLQPATLRQLPIEVIEVTFDVSTKVKSLIAALRQQVKIPLIFVRMFLLLFKLKGANKEVHPYTAL